ncbi:MAG: DNA-3-methyladenine glycosylase [Candidatus Obscuribacterales bacterium]|nr:DNA-3-methyladenine glycosylase [Candidatus Obscuribacterales bacterium]
MKVRKKLNRDFFAGPTVDVAPKLLGMSLVRTLPSGQVVRAPIVEVEAYTQDDPACHAYRGITERCRVMFGPPGFAYVYFIYGMYYCLNVVTECEGTPGAVLIRALGITGAEGPGKLCRHWQIDKSLNGADLLDQSSLLYLEPGTEYGCDQISVTERIGINVARERPWRFFVTGHAHVSGRKRGTAGAKREKAVLLQ